MLYLIAIITSLFVGFVVGGRTYAVRAQRRLNPSADVRARKLERAKHEIRKHPINRSLRSNELKALLKKKKGKPVLSDLPDFKDDTSVVKRVKGSLGERKFDAFAPREKAELVEFQINLTAEKLREHIDTQSAVSRTFKDSMAQNNKALSTPSVEEMLELDTPEKIWDDRYNKASESD